jgi:class 3 adenylate cyclase/tetratricopeptide (TPR) repeat protein
MDVGDWLRSLGLGQFEAAFRDNEIDGEVLPKLTSDDLKELGVASVGQRRKLLSAIESLAAALAPPTAAPKPSQPHPEPVAGSGPTAPTTTETAERRHLTVMFCDLVGSTSISATLDAEDWRDIVGGYLDAASAAVTRMGGHVAKKLGDGIMALFGYPLVQENDAERALRAALEIQRSLAEINAKNAGSGRPKLEARIGVETGAVVVDSLGEIFGDAPNVAARVQAAAEPGSVWTTARVQRQVAGLFVAEDCGAYELKGVLEPVVLYRIVRASGGGRRSGQRALTPLVGRAEELTMLLGRWERARAGEGQFVTIVAEPGLGKSRLIEEFRARLVDTPYTWVEWASSQLLQNTPLHPIADWGRQRFGGADTPVERRLADLETALQAVKLDPAEHVPLLAPLLDMPLPEDRVAKFVPEELRRRQMAAMQAWLTAGARVQPIVLAFEDLHWADPTTLDLMRGLAERGALAPLFVVATTRPEFRAPWGARSHHGAIALTPLDRRQVAIMVAELAAKHSFSPAIVEGVNERTGGVPLFVEEVTRLLLERGEQGGAHAIPPTLQQSLSARLDRLGPAREVAMIGAVLGRAFSYPLLKAIVTPVAAVADRGRADLNEAGYRGPDEAGLQAALEKLAEADILLVEGLPPQAEYRFKHALIQDAAYENLLKSRRQALHRRAAETLRDQFPDRAAAQPEVLAHHFTEAGLSESAIEYWGRAGDQALRRSAFQEAIAHLGRAIEMADKAESAVPRHVVEDAAAAGQRLKLQTDYGQAVMFTRGFAAEETRAAFARAAKLAANSEDFSGRFAAAHGQWTLALVRGELKSARELASTFLREAEGLGSFVEIGVASRGLAIISYLLGDFANARIHCERALAACDPERDREARERFSEDTCLTAMSWLVITMWQLGEVEHARKLIEAANRRSAELGHAPSMAHPLQARFWLEFSRGDNASALAAAEALEALGREHGMPFWLANAKASVARARVRLNDPAGGAVEFEQALAALTESAGGDWLDRALLAERELRTRGVDGALARIDEALALARRQEFQFNLPFAHLLRGEILFKRDSDDPAPAEEAFQTAIAVAREQGARSWGLRAALSLAKLYQSTGRPAQAHDVLAPALEGFAPTPEMPEIAEGKALLATLAQRRASAG